VWEIAAGTNTITALSSFQGTNGTTPPAAPTLDSLGNFYGVTVSGGANHLGTVWELASGNHTITTLASFNGANGVNPHDTVSVDSQGNDDGTSSVGGSSHDGTVLELAMGSSTITVLGAFAGPNGGSPYGSVAVVTPTGCNPRKTC
jgi:uncharacterized repeat protein (TIGR03803 family)